VFSTSSRFDRRWRFGLTQSFQVAKDVAIVVQLQRDIVSSNLPLYAYTSNSQRRSNRELVENTAGLPLVLQHGSGAA
jgi:hypothetical protein